MLRKRRVRKAITSFVVERYGESWKSAMGDLESVRDMVKKMIPDDEQQAADLNDTVRELMS